MHSRVIFNNIKQADVFQNENEQARQIITELSNLPNFQGQVNVNPSAIIKGFKSKKDLNTFCSITANIWMCQQNDID